MARIQLDDLMTRIRPLDEAAMAQARQRQDTLTKPAGSLGRLEEISVRLAGIFGTATPEIHRKVIILAAGDHGVSAEGISAYHQEVTAQMVLNFLGGGAGINVLARHVGAEVVVVDAGVAAELLAHPDLYSVKLGRGTANIAQGPAMSRAQALRSIEEGAQLALEQVSSSADILGTGNMGIRQHRSSRARRVDHLGGAHPPSRGDLRGAE